MTPTPIEQELDSLNKLMRERSAYVEQVKTGTSS